MNREMYARRLYALGLNLNQAARDMQLSTGTPSRWRDTGIPGYAIAYLVALEALGTDEARAEFRRRLASELAAHLAEERKVP